MPEVVTPSPEIRSVEFSPLVFEARSLLYGVRQGDTSGPYAVTEHTDARTVISTGNPREAILHFVFEDTPQGVLARRLESRLTPDGMMTDDNTILLATPRTSRMLHSLRGSMSKTMHHPTHDVNSVLDEVTRKSDPLSHEAAEQWYIGVHTLLGYEWSPDQKSQSKGPGGSRPHGHLFRRHVSRA